MEFFSNQSQKWQNGKLEKISKMSPRINMAQNYNHALKTKY